MVAGALLAEFLREHFAPQGSISLCRMFGKTWLFWEQVMFALVAEYTLYFRIATSLVSFAEAAAKPSLNYEKGGKLIDLSFWRTCDRLADDPEALRDWSPFAQGRRLPDRNVTLMVGAGWHAHLDVLAARLGGRQPGPFWDEWTRLKSEYDRRLQG